MNAKKIIVKNKTNWFLALILPISLIVLLFIIVVILPIIAMRDSYFFSIIVFGFASDVLKS